MTTRGRHRKPGLLSTIGVLMLGTGLIAWAWTGRWEWAATGGCSFLVLASIGAYIDGRST